MAAIHPIEHLMKVNPRARKVASYSKLATATGLPEAKVQKALRGEIQLPAFEMKKIEDEFRKLVG